MSASFSRLPPIRRRSSERMDVVLIAASAFVWWNTASSQWRARASKASRTWGSTSSRRMQCSIKSDIPGPACASVVVGARDITYGGVVVLARSSDGDAPCGGWDGAVRAPFLFWFCG
eukprot:CAMPEP_0115879116 /NCGR_PEP_ID=MMETSP0287-20121206/27145_1 /TAXON_ID=412157 /ORGANISM="Chrysochromulina rotalis, Strain UIO044" /LENGTH=116 /DNA_ID=CAMNT_0003334797 /DNA_START=173 /DNA_END=523 /DNA_ORIENTATION=-